MNKIYEQADIYTKRNSIGIINKKGQKRQTAAFTNASPSMGGKLTGKEEGLTQSSHIRENPFFQEIHPADVEKKHDDNIFDYRLHMKLARGEEIFKVEEVKRKTKKRNIAGKECECCAK